MALICSGNLSDFFYKIIVIDSIIISTLSIQSHDEIGRFT